MSATEPEEDSSSDRVLTVPNAISFVRLLMVPVVLVLILTGRDVAAVVVLVCSGASDWADGVLRIEETSRLSEVSEARQLGGAWSTDEEKEISQTIEEEKLLKRIKNLN